MYSEEQGDLEGRAITIEHDKFSLTNVYVPNSGGRFNSIHSISLIFNISHTHSFFYIYLFTDKDGLKRLDYRTRQWDRRLSEFMMEQRDKTPERIAILTGKPSILKYNYFVYLN